MQNKKWRKCIPLKITAQVVMFLAFIGFLISLVYGLFYLETYYGNYARYREKTEYGYFNTSRFSRDFSKAMDDTINFLNAVDMELDDENADYWAEAFLGAYVNYQYAIYDPKGELLFKSDGFTLTPEAAKSSGIGETSQLFYYVVDTAGLELYSLPGVFYDSDESVTGTMTGGNFLNDHWGYFLTDEFQEKIGYMIAYVPEKLTSGDIFFEHFQMVGDLSQWAVPMAIVAALSGIIFIACLIYTLMASGWSAKTEGIRLYWLDRIYTEVLVFLTFVVGTYFFVMCGAFIGWIIEGRHVIDIVLMGLMVVPSYICMMVTIYSITRRAKAHNLLRQSLLYKMCHYMYQMIYQGLINNHLTRKYVAVVLGFGLLDLMLMLLAVSSYSLWWPFLTLIVYIWEFIYVFRKLMVISEIAKGAKEIAAGKLDYKIRTEEMGSGVFLQFADNINNIGQGLNRAVDESIKSERMKADLITNVSHDIKTPLTSIINYVDLLKRLGIDEEPAKEYIDILDSKSQRLKMLIEDLVEASRASSGNIVLECTDIDFNELVRQIAGTYAEKYEQRRLSLVLGEVKEPLLIHADGRRMYRVLDNLFNNAFKYAMENSRIYVDFYADDSQVTFIMKNISQAPLNITAEELTQRFVRGDVSRTTEGSGLGLSIAESLVKLQNGSFKIHLDGDLFKAVITMSRVAPMPSDTEEAGDISQL